MGYMASLYPDKRGSVSGIIAGVYGGASIFLSPMLAGMIESRSLSFALTVAGGAALVVIFAVAMLIQPVPQGYLEYKCGSGSAGAGRAARSVYDLDRAGMVKTAMFYVAIVAFAFGCTSGMMVISQVSAIMQESFALTATQAAFYVSIMSFMSMSGRFLWGIVTDHFDKYITLCIICGLPVIAMGVLAVSDAMMVAVACLAVTALCYGGFGSTITPITADLFGAAHVTENYGVMYLAFGFAGLAGPQIAVKLSTGGDYSMAFPGCLCHFRCGLCHGADCSPESTGCDSQLTFSINPLFCGPSSRNFPGGGLFIEAPRSLWVRRSPIRK